VSVPHKLETTVTYPNVVCIPSVALATRVKDLEALKLFRLLHQVNTNVEEREALRMSDTKYAGAW
jgi:hypothetical protein